MYKRFRPVLDRVLVRKITAPEKTIGGIVLPQKVKPKIWQAKVLSVGPGYHDHNGKFRKPTVSEGDVVYLSEYGGNEIEIEDETFGVYREEDILGIIKEADSSTDQK